MDTTDLEISEEPIAEGSLQQATRKQTILAARRPQTVREYIGRCTPELMKALPEGMDAQRVARIALTAVTRNEGLSKCTPQSFAGALLTAAAYGLEPNTPTAEAYLVPYGGNCQLIIGYQGLIKLFMQHPLAVSLDTQPVYPSDYFDYRHGSDAYLTHKPNPAGRAEKNEEPYGFWAQAVLTNGAKPFEFMTVQEVSAVRAPGKQEVSAVRAPGKQEVSAVRAPGKQEVSAVRAPGKQEIRDPQHWMARKTVVKQLMKRLPKSEVLAAAVHADEQLGSELVPVTVEEISE